MTDQTTYRQKIRNEKEEIDLVQMIQYVLQKWKILLLAGVVGLLLGGAFGAMKTGKEPAQMDINDLNADQIQQYANYHQFYEDEVARQKESIYMNMDPGAVYMADKSYYVAAQESDLNRLGLAISSILPSRPRAGRHCSGTSVHRSAQGRPFPTATRHRVRRPTVRRWRRQSAPPDADR